MKKKKNKADVTPKKITVDHAAVLEELVKSPAKRPASEAQYVVREHRKLIRKAMRAGHSPGTIAERLGVKKRSLQRALSADGMFFRTPRVNAGVVVKAFRGKKYGKVLFTYSPKFVPFSTTIINAS